MKKTTFFGSLLLAAAAFACLLYAPAAALAGARRGLGLCAGIIIPSLLPFLICSGLLSALGAARLLGRWAAPVTRRLFGVSGAAAAPFLLGLTGGYPVGAAAVAELIKHGDLTADEGGRLLPFCNNTGPAFIVGVAGSGVFGSTAVGLVLYACHILAAVCVGVLFSLGRRKKTPPAPPAVLELHSLPEVLPGCVAGAVGTTLNICGYVVFFSVITGLLDALGLVSGLSGALALRCAAELRFTRALLSGLLELGSGIGSMAGLAPSPGNLALAAFILGFGSLSVHCQTLAAVSGTDVKTARHFAGRLLHGLMSALFAYLFFTLLQT